MKEKIKQNKGGRPRKLTPLEEMGVYEMHKDNIPIAEIAYKSGISTSTVQRIVSKFKEDLKNENRR